MTPNHRPFGGELFNNAKFRAKVMEELTLICNKKEYANQAAFNRKPLAYRRLSKRFDGRIFGAYSLGRRNQNRIIAQRGFLGNLLQIAIEMNHANDAQNIVNSINDTQASFTTDRSTRHAPKRSFLLKKPNINQRIET